MTANLSVFLAKKPLPLAILALLQFLPKNNKILVEFHNEKTPAFLLLSNGTKVAGISAVAKHILRSSFVASEGGVALLGKDAQSVQLVEEWMEYSERNLSSVVFKDLNDAMLHLDSHLKFRSFLVGYAVTCADLCVYGALKCMFIFILFMFLFAF